VAHGGEVRHQGALGRQKGLDRVQSTPVQPRCGSGGAQQAKATRGHLPAQGDAQPCGREGCAVAHFLEHGVALQLRNAQRQQQRAHRLLKHLIQRHAATVGQLGLGVQRQQHRHRIAHAPADVAAQRAQVAHTQRAQLTQCLDKQGSMLAHQCMPAHGLQALGRTDAQLGAIGHDAPALRPGLHIDEPDAARCQARLVPFLLHHGAAGDEAHARAQRVGQGLRGLRRGRRHEFHGGGLSARSRRPAALRRSRLAVRAPGRSFPPSSGSGRTRNARTR
jgi:hypothetical protein